MKLNKEVLLIIKNLIEKNPLTFIIIGFFVVVLSIIFQDEIKLLITDKAKVVINISPKEKKVVEDSSSVIKITYDQTAEIRYKKAQVRKKLTEIRKRYDSLGCAYVAVNVFREKLKSKNGTRFKIMSREYESRKHDRKDLTDLLDNFELDPYLDEFVILESEGYLYIKDSKKCNYKAIVDALNLINIKSVFYIALKDESVIYPTGENYVMGYMSIEFSEPTNFDDRTMQQMREEERYLKNLIKEIKEIENIKKSK